MARYEYKTTKNNQVNIRTLNTESYPVPGLSDEEYLRRIQQIAQATDTYGFAKAKKMFPAPSGYEIIMNAFGNIYFNEEPTPQQKSDRAIKEMDERYESMLDIGRYTDNG